MRMRKYRLLSGFLSGYLLALSGISLSAVAQTTAPNEWTWVGGSETAPPVGSGVYGQSGIYGTLGTPALGNIPGARDGASTWTDRNGYLWLFGGGGIETGAVLFNDLWEFSPSTDQWVWMGGSSSSGGPPVYGILGQFAAGNSPGARSNAATWIDHNGNLWLFGGEGLASNGFSALNDLWEFNPSTDQWAWMGGSSTLNCYTEYPNPGGAPEQVCSPPPGLYGTLGTPSAGNIPGGRSQAASWTDSNGNFWLFGGTGADAVNNVSYLNDLWEFHPSTNQWAWMGGDNTIPFTNTGLAPVWGAPGVYGILGTPALGNIPGARRGASSWTDRSGNLWLFGGTGIDANGNGVEPSDETTDLNDLWQFNPSTEEWTWMGGSSTLDCVVSTSITQPGMVFCSPPFAAFGTLGTPAAGNVPGGKSYAVSWSDNIGYFWLFGGAGLWGTNDLWRFSPSTLQWTWMGGNGPGEWGTLGVPSAGNIPGNRTRASSWTDSNSNFWLFGGTGTDAVGTTAWLNDVWEYQPSSTPSFPTTATPVFSPVSGSYTSHQTIAITDATPGAAIYYTTDGITMPTTSSTQYTGPITVGATQTIQVVAVAANYLNSAVASANYTINLPQVTTPTFSLISGTYTSPQTITISDATAGATIYYTTDGSTPTASSAVYIGPITVSSTETLEAIATASGDSNSAVASATYTINLPPPDFTVAINPASISVQAGQNGTTTITVHDENGFNSNISFACSGLPAGATCSFSMQTVPTPSGVTYSTLTVSTLSTTAALHSNGRPLLPGSVLAVVLCCLGWKRRRRLQVLLLLAVSVAGLSLFNGCGGKASSQPTTSTVTVTATSGSLQHTAILSLMVN
jgi:N-acetylneuraminic acid mutarotase